MKEVPKEGLIRLLDEIKKSVRKSIYITPDSFPEYVEEISVNDSVKEAAWKIKRSETGAVIFCTEGKCYLIIPPFPVEKDEVIVGFDRTGIDEILSKKRTLGVILIRLGAYAIGIFANDKLLTSKCGTRYVGPSHRKGGMSQARFARIRQKQKEEFFKVVCEEVKKRFYKIDYVFLGGDKSVTADFLRKCNFLQRFKVSTRILYSREAKHRNLELMPKEVWKSKVLILQ